MLVALAIVAVLDLEIGSGSAAQAHDLVHRGHALRAGLHAVEAVRAVVEAVLILGERGQALPVLGIALDGDADRVILVDEKGQVIDGDQMLAMCATRMVADGALKKKTVVATVMSNLGLEHALSGIGAKLVRTQVGDRYVVEAMRSGGYNLGGEQSGHLLFLDHTSTGDGVLAALQVLALMLRSGKSVSELADSAMQRVPQVLENVTLPARRPLENMRRLGELTAKVTRQLGDGGRVLIRWSGTEPKLRIMLEGPREDRIHAWAKDLAAAARRDVEG